MSTQPTQPEALRLADEFNLCDEYDSIPSMKDIAKAGTELRRLHALTQLENVAADAYSHACDEMERWQRTRQAAGKEVGTTGSLCDGIAWLYQHIDDLEANLCTPQPVVREPLGKEALYEVLHTACLEMLDMAKDWADNKIHAYQFTHEAEIIINAVVRRAEAAHGIKGGQT